MTRGYRASRVKLTLRRRAKKRANATLSRAVVAAQARRRGRRESTPPPVRMAVAQRLARRTTSV